jgi:hypothetical protein
MYQYSGNGIIKKSSVDQKPNWYYIICDESIANYYKWFFSRGLNTWYPSMNGVHITIVAGEKEKVPINCELIDRYLNTNVEFNYDNIIYTNGRAFWLNCHSEYIDNIRYKMNLPKRNLHLTLGNIKNRIGIN